MKRQFFNARIFMSLIMLVAFSFQMEGKEIPSNVHKMTKSVENVLKLSNEEMQLKRQRLMASKLRKDELMERYSSSLNSQKKDSVKGMVTIEETTEYTYFQDGQGDVYMTALCYNAGTTYAAMIKATVTFYDRSMNVLGTDDAWIYGGTQNVQYGTGGYCTNELAPGEYGFFWLWPDIAYSDAAYYSVTFTGEDSTNYPYSNAILDFQDGVYGTDYAGYLDFFGDIYNFSQNYVTYYTEVFFAVFNTDDSKVIDVDSTYVDGSTYNESTSAIYPGTYEPFDLLFYMAQYSQASGSYFSAFEWYEAVYSNMEEADPPFGSFDTPLEGATVASSIPVTGWALDDTAVGSVKIYRESTNGLIYIGDAIGVEGARPDVAALYPEYPNNTKAGWGYMLLTNFLPNNGNGTFVLHAIASDVYGKTTTLGTKTIICDNAHAVKPFGAIDTPLQGGLASGDSYVNWGWALTPQPKYIPTDGSTLWVYVDGVPVGQPTYNIYRSDIATKFPSYANCEGAVGYFYLDTTAYTNGLHTIQWRATDNEGSSDGIGSRYFTISNGSSLSSDSLHLPRAIRRAKVRNISQLERIPVDDSMSIDLTSHQEVRIPLSGTQSVALQNGSITIDELQPFQITLNKGEKSKGHWYSGYCIVGDQLRSLPIGSTLNAQTGEFSWSPGPGHLGSFKLVFIETAPNGQSSRKHVTIKIKPANSK